MTLQQIQHLLAYLDYYTIPVDGITGPGTVAAVRTFQRDFGGLAVDGIPGRDTEKALRHAVAYGMPERGLAEGVGQGTGDKTEPAMAEAAKYLQADGCYHIPRGVDVQLTKNFRAREIHCQGKGCCTESVISKRIMDLAQAIRDDLGEPLSIATAGGSGYRCPVHNARVSGAAKNSLHTISDAVDLHYHDPDKLRAVILRHLTDGEVGRYPWGCHVGCWDRGCVNQFR